jgi:hypothetical protein
MKITLLTLSIVAALSVTANAENAVPKVEATQIQKAWVIMAMLSSGSPEDASRHMRAHGFSDIAVGQLLAHTRATKQKLAEVGRAAYSDLCRNQDLYLADREAYAQHFEKLVRDTKQIQASAVEKLSTVLTGSDYAAFNEFVEHAAPRSAPSVDYSQLVRSQAFDVQGVLNRYCNDTELKSKEELRDKVIDTDREQGTPWPTNRRLANFVSAPSSPLRANVRSAASSWPPAFILSWPERQSRFPETESS